MKTTLNSRGEKVNEKVLLKFQSLKLLDDCSVTVV